MYSTMTWRIFDSLVRQYCKTDQETPKPFTFRNFCNARLYQIMGVLDALDDPRYRRSHVLFTSGTLIYKASISALTANSITHGATAWVVGSMVQAVWNVGGVYSHMTGRVRTVAGQLYTLDVLSGAIPALGGVTACVVWNNTLFVGSWDSQLVRLRNVHGITDAPVQGSVATVRRFYGYTRFETYRAFARDFAMETEVGYYNRGGVVEMTKGTSAPAIAVPTLEFDCMPSPYTELTAGNRIELLPEHVRMLFDGVASQVLKALERPEPDDLKARMLDDVRRLQTARADDIAGRRAQEQQVTE